MYHKPRIHACIFLGAIYISIRQALGQCMETVCRDLQKTECPGTGPWEPVTEISILGDSTYQLVRTCPVELEISALIFFRNDRRSVWSEITRRE